MTYNIIHNGQYYKTMTEPFTDNRDFAANFTNKEIADKIAARVGGTVIENEFGKDINEGM